MSQQSRHPDAWNDASAYEQFMGRWSLLVGRTFLEWLAIPTGRRWLDVGCGTGALSRTVVEMATPARLAGIDSSQGYVSHALRTQGNRRVHFAVGAATKLPLGTSLFDVAVSGLVLNFVSSPEGAASEMARVVRPGGTVGVYVWDYAGRMQFLRYFWDAAREIDPAGRALDEGSRFPLCRPEALRELFLGAGLSQVEWRGIEIPTRFRDFEDYWSPFTGGQGSAPSYLRSLDADRAGAIRERLRALLPASADGSIDLSARAWAIKGTVA